MGQVNYPRMKIEIAGQGLDRAWISNHQNGYFHGNKSSANIPMWGNGQFDDTWFLGLGADGSTVPVKVWGGQGSASGAVAWGSEPIFDGILLNKRLDYLNGVVEIEAVDRVQLLVQYKLYQAYPNKTGSEIIRLLAAAVGMTANVQGATHLAGPMYSKSHMRLQHGDFSKATTAWDLICDIARQTGNVAFVKGNTVYVQPNTPDTGAAWPVIYGKPTIEGQVATWTTPSNVNSLTCHHNLLASRDMTVEVQGFHSGKGKPFSVRAGPQRNRTNHNQSNYIYGPYPNLSEAQAQAKANAIYRDLTLHEYTWEFEAPSDFSLTPYRTVTINGLTGPAQTTYYVHDLMFRTDEECGSLMNVTVKSYPPQNDTNF